MKTKDVKELFERAGWVEFPAKQSLTQGVVACFASRALQGGHCDCNDRPPQVHAQVHDFRLPQMPNQVRSVTFKVTGEHGGQWASLQVYGVSFEEVEQYLYKAVTVGQALWDAYCKAMSHDIVVTGTGTFGVSTGRDRMRVVCNTCKTIIHKATTGPEQNVRVHILRGPAAYEEPMIEAGL